MCGLQGGCRRPRRPAECGKRGTSCGGRAVTAIENPRPSLPRPLTSPCHCRLRFLISCPVRAPAGPSKCMRYAAGPRTHVNCKTNRRRAKTRKRDAVVSPSPQSALRYLAEAPPGASLTSQESGPSASHVTDVHRTQHQKSYTCITSMLMDRQKRITLSKYGTSTQSDADVGGVWPVPSTGNW